MGPGEADSRWCLGLPFAAVAPLTALESDAVEKRFGFLRGQTILGVLILVASLGVAVGTLVRGRHVGDDAVPEIALGAALYLGILIGIAAAFLILRDVVGEAVRLAGDRRRAQVLVFRQAGEAQAAAVELRVLPNTRLLLRQQADRVEFLPVRIQQAAPPPGYQWRVPLHRDLVVSNVPEGTTLEQRQLTALERAEIARYSHVYLRPDLALLVHALFSAMVFLNWHSASAFERLLLAPTILFFTALRILAYATRVAMASRMRTDLEVGRVVTPSDSSAGATVHEFLPISRALWTVSGRPAKWREAGDTLRPAA